MNIQHLRYFLSVMDTGSVSRAATASGVTQPTLSAALKGLEHAFGVTLFAAEGRGIRPLPAAKLLERNARLAINALSDARRELSGTPSIRLTFGVLPSLAQAWLPRLISACDGLIEIVEAMPDDLETAVRGGALDMAITTSPARGGLQRKSLICEPFLLFVGAAHQLAGRRSVSIAELNGQPFVLRQCCEHLGTGRRLLAAASVRFRITARTRQETTAAALVAAGVGITLAPKSWYHPGVSAIPLTGFTLQRDIGLIWTSKVNAKAVAKLAKTLETQAATLTRG